MSSYDRQRSVCVVIPTYKPGDTLRELLEAIAAQTLQCSLILIDSSPPDYVHHLPMLKAAGVGRVVLEGSFDHGYARNVALRMSEARAHTYVVFLTQDCIPASRDALEQLLLPFEGSSIVAASTGRQLAGATATTFARMSRAVMYPAEREGREKLGLYSTSNSFAAYHVERLQAVGGFPEPCLFGEDAVASSWLRAAGYSVAYAANAVAFHAHNYSLSEEFRRQFDAGASHALTPGEQNAHDDAKAGAILSGELQYLRRQGDSALIPAWLGRIGAKAVGYALGRSVRILPRRVAVGLSLSPHILGKLLASDRSSA